MESGENLAYEFVDWMKKITELSEEDQQKFADDFWSFTEQRREKDQGDDGFEIVLLEAQKAHEEEQIADRSFSVKEEQLGPSLKADTEWVDSTEFHWGGSRIGQDESQDGSGALLCAA